LPAQATIRAVSRPRLRRTRTEISYAFQPAAGGAIQAECLLPRRFPVHTLAPGLTLEVLYDPANPQLNKPRLALEYIEFADVSKSKPQQGVSPPSS
jgi:hypothetical protein